MNASGYRCAATPRTPARFSAGSESFADIAPVAAAHHERLDGKGYPLGLSEQQIGSETRIITICDFYDALTADRPYRAAMPRDKALDIIGGTVGTVVDPDCFEALHSTT